MAARLHCRQLGGANQIARLFGFRHMQRHHVGAGQHRIQAVELTGIAQRQPGFNIVKHHLHAQAFGQDANLGADMAVADDAQCLAAHFVGVVSRFHPAATMRQRIALRNAAHQQDGFGQYQFGHRAGIGKRRIEHRNAAPGSHLINASRGTVVDIDALAAALHSKHLHGAAIDVFPHEPQANGDEFLSPLRGLDNVLLTPHIGGSTQEAQANIGAEVASKLIRYSDNGSTLSAVNFPEVSLPAHPGKGRLLHIHRNQPGMLARINALFSGQNINICAQYLQTSGEIGYVVIDTDSAAPAAAQAMLQAIDGTLRCRLLY